jgi:hypothetical protein
MTPFRRLLGRRSDARCVVATAVIRSSYRDMVPEKLRRSADRPSGTRPAAEYRGTVRELREALAEAGQRIDRLMVIRRRQLVAARSRRAGN